MSLNARLRLLLGAALLVATATAALITSQPPMEQWYIRLAGMPGVNGIRHTHCEPRPAPGEGYGYLWCFDSSGEPRMRYPLWRLGSAWQVVP